MNCEEIQDTFLDYVEGLLEEPQLSEILAHVEGCAKCRFGLQQTRELIGAMHDVKSGQEKTAVGSQAKGPAPVIPAASWRPGSRLGDFEIVEEIGRGGMGVVYRARQVSLGRHVALKILPSLLTSVRSAVARFQKEAQAAAKLHHTNIVPVYAQGDFEGHFFYAMELVDGESLDRILRKDPARFVDLVSSHDTVRRGTHRHLARLIAGVAEGLEHAHRQGVLHRDIKPQNLLLGRDGQLHITDFGLARILDEPSLTLSGDMLGTPAYMSPEQVTADRRKIDHRTDIYSLGVTFYELLTGRRPFEGATREQTIARICTREPRPPRKWNPHIPIDLETICLRAMEKEPNRRYARAGDLAADLRRYSDDRPIVSRRVGPIERAIKWVRRHPALATIYAMSVILVAGAATWSVQTVRARHARANELVQQAYSILAFEDYHESERAHARLAEAEALHPDEWTYRRALGLANLATNRDKAIEHLTWAVNKKPDDTTTMYILAWAYRQQAGRLDAPAKKWLDKADENGGAKTPEAHFFRGQVLVKQEDQAEEEYRRARIMKPDYTQALIHLGRALNYWMYHYRKHDKYHEQLQCLDAVCMVQSDRGYPFYLKSLAHRLSAEIYQESGDPSKKEEVEKEFALALDDARKAQAVEPNNPLCYFAEAEYWDVRRDYTRAIAARDQSESYCIERERRAELCQYRWRPYYWTGQYDKALRDLGVLTELRGQADPLSVWYRGLFPSLIAAEQNRLDIAVSLNLQMAKASPESFRAITSAACMLRILGRVVDADRTLAEHAGRINFTPSAEAEISPAFMRAAYELCRHRCAPDAVFALAPSTQRERLVKAVPSFFEAADALARGDRAQAAVLFRQCDMAYDSEDYCYMARVFVRRIEADSTWPKWIGPTDLKAPNLMP